MDEKFSKDFGERVIARTAMARVASIAQENKQASDEQKELQKEQQIRNSRRPGITRYRVWSWNTWTGRC